MAENTQDGVTVGGAYKESDDHVPNPTDLYGTFNTSGTGAHHDPATMSPIFDVDRAHTAAEIAKALDPEDPTPSSRVLLPEGQNLQVVDPEAAKAELLAKAEAVLEHPVEVGGPSAAEAEAGEEGKDGAAKAAGQTQAQGDESEGAKQATARNSAKK